MTGIEKKKRLFAGGSRTYRNDGVEEYYGGGEDDPKFAVTYDPDADEFVIRHRGSGDEMRIGAGYQSLPIRSSAPSSPSAGDVALQDGSSWNPSGSGSVELVAYDGSNWVSA